MTFEHLPPKSAFNKSKVLVVSFEQAMALGPEQPTRQDGRWQQKGAGMYSLCDDCNNNTGAWYVPAYAEFARQAVQYLPREGELTQDPVSCAFTNLDLHRVIKQVLTIFVSVAGPGFAITQRLASYLLNEQSVDWPTNMRVFAYLSKGPKCRVAGLSAAMNFLTGHRVLLSEFSFPPLGFVLTVDSDRTKVDYRRSRPSPSRQLAVPRKSISACTFCPLT